MPLFLLASSLAFLSFDLAVLGFFLFEPRIVVRLVFIFEGLAATHGRKWLNETGEDVEINAVSGPVMTVDGIGLCIRVEELGWLFRGAFVLIDFFLFGAGPLA